MDITRENKGELKAELKIKIEPEDYKTGYENALKEYRKKLNLPGFRQGRVPLGLVKSRYGKPLLAEEINKVLNWSIPDYIKNNELNVLGSPMPVDENQAKGDWENPETFEFKYEMGLAPDFEIDLANDLSLDYYKMKVDEKLIDKQVNEMARRYGSLRDVDESGGNHMVSGHLAELDENEALVEDGLTATSIVVTNFIEDEAEKEKLIGLKLGDEVIIDPHKVSSSAKDMARMLDIDEAQVPTIKAHFKLWVEKIQELVPAGLDQTLFDKVYGEGEVSSEEEFRARVKAELEQTFSRDSERMFHRDMQLALLEKHDMELPEDFLKRWIRENNEKPVTAEEVENDFDEYKRGLKWELIRNKIVEKHNVKVEAPEATAKTKSLIAQNYQQYGMPVPGDEELEQSATQVLARQDEARRVFEMLYEDKIAQLVQEEAEVNEKEVDYDTFVDLANQS